MTLLIGFVALSLISRTSSFNLFLRDFIEFSWLLNSSSATSPAFIPNVAVAPIRSAPLKTVAALFFMLSDLDLDVSALNSSSIISLIIFNKDSSGVDKSELSQEFIQICLKSLLDSKWW